MNYGNGFCNSNSRYPMVTERFVLPSTIFEQSLTILNKFCEPQNMGFIENMNLFKQWLVLSVSFGQSYCHSIQIQATVVFCSFTVILSDDEVTFAFADTQTNTHTHTYTCTVGSLFGFLWPKQMRKICDGYVVRSL